MGSRVNIVIPARNEAAVIGDVLSETVEAVSVLEDNYNAEANIVVVDDHSRDGTAQVVRQFESVELLPNTRPPGKGNALISGFEAGDGDILVMMDADYSHRPHDLPQFLTAIESGADLVLGSRYRGGSDEFSLVRRTGNRLLTSFFNALFQRRFTDVLNGYKCFRRNLVIGHEFRSSGFDIEVELVASALNRDMTVVEVPTHERARAGGVRKSRVHVHGPQFAGRTLLEFLRARAVGR